MSTVLALELLYEDVLARFAAELPDDATAIEQPFGWREPARRLAGRRIVWVPGDEDAIGDLRGPTKPGRNPRPLYTLDELCTIYVEAYDTDAPENERAQWRACRLLMDALLRALYLAASPRVKVVDMTWVNDKNERRAGATARIVISIESMIPDAEILTSTTASETTLSLLSADDALETEDPTP